MTVKQISIFVENKPGKLLEVVKILAQEKIDMRALSIAETSDYGILRLIVDDPEKAEAALKDAGWVTSVTPVVAVKIPDEPGSLDHVLTILADAKISIEYSYAFLTGQKDSACLVMRVEDTEETKEILTSHGVEVVGQETFKN